MSELYHENKKSGDTIRMALPCVVRPRGAYQNPSQTAKTKISRCIRSCFRIGPDYIMLLAFLGR